MEYMKGLKARFPNDPLMANSLNAVQGVDNTPEEQEAALASINDVVEGAGGAVGSVKVKAAQEAKPALEGLRKAFTPQAAETIASREARIGKLGAQMDKAREAERIAATNKYIETKLPRDAGEESLTFFQKLASKIKSAGDIDKLEELARNNPDAPQLNDQRFMQLIGRLRERFPR